MRYLIVSDLHANWQALDAVVRDAAGSYDQAVCCGDLVGYGGDPNPVVDWVRANCRHVVRGNHDRACTGQDDLEWFNPVARQAALWTARDLSPESIAYIVSLPRGPLFLDNFELIHGSPFDEDEYLLAPEEAGQAFGYLERRVAFFGHTHVQGGFIWNHSRVETLARPTANGDNYEIAIDPECAYLLNPGSVGQPRDGDPRASFVIFDSQTGQVTYRRTPYDIEGAQKKIRDAGLAPILADRLLVGR